MEYPVTAQKLIKLKNEDLAFRDKLIQNGQLGDGYHPEMEAIHIRNAEQLEEIIKDIGYPTISKVGEAGSQAAWLIIQHAISKPAFMKRCMALLEVAIQEGQAATIHLAYLTDRIATFEDKVQMYGTAFDWDENGVMNPKPYDNLVKVNQRRADLELNSLEEQTELMRKQAHNELEQSPIGKVQKKLQFDHWRRAVGWIK